MSYGLYISAAGAQAQRQRIEVLANNLANVDTPAFNRDLAVFQASHSEAIEQGQDYAGSRSINDIGGGVFLHETTTDFGRGALKQTKIPTDFAILGDGFFVVDRGGQQLLTRAGNFTLDASGGLISQDGYPVLTAEGTPVQVTGDLPWTVNERGMLVQAGDSTPLALRKPRSLGDLVKVGQNLYSPLAETIPLAGAERRVRSGWLEQSGVSPTTEMMELIEASRAFEANAQLIRSQDQMIGTLVNRVLRTS